MATATVENSTIFIQGFGSVLVSGGRLHDHGVGELSALKTDCGPEGSFVFAERLPVSVRTWLDIESELDGRPDGRYTYLGRTVAGPEAPISVHEGSGLMLVKED